MGTRCKLLKSINNPNYHDLPPQFPPDYAAAWGEDQYGVWFDLRIENVVQRFRWIPAGEFTMGSLEDEDEREKEYEPWSGKETQHIVTLSKGYWLADTACTQVLWKLIMGDNPANFKDSSQNPVDNVSWLDTHEFLDKLNIIIPNLKAQLPSEAQWEYACRAGTITPFSFGETITPEQANYNGNHPYAMGKKGEVRGKTIMVKSLPANQWGLYQMHGNVWEWCLDAWRIDLGMSSVLDPVNIGIKSDNDRSVGRILRGGSWINYGRGCRSAVRNGYAAGNRYRYYGFRFALGYEHELLLCQTGARSDNGSEAGRQRKDDTARREVEWRRDQVERGWIDKIKRVASKLMDKK